MLPPPPPPPLNIEPNTRPSEPPSAGPMAPPTSDRATLSAIEPRMLQKFGRFCGSAALLLTKSGGRLRAQPCAVTGIRRPGLTTCSVVDTPAGDSAYSAEPTARTPGNSGVGLFGSPSV